MAVEQDIREATFQLGFCAVGFTPVTPIQTWDIYDEWLDAGKNAGMDYLRKNRDLRRNPTNLAQYARSAIVVAATYPVNKTPGKGFSTHAAGADYHEVIRGKLRSLAESIREWTTLETSRVCVDSAPVAERDLAIAAGIGWRGRQGQIVNEHYGCCLLIGILLVDIDLEPSKPVPNRCGDCMRCMNACPTGALEQDGRVDCRKCISYLTIEHKGDFTAVQAKAIGQSLYGCDFCTSICPWNSKSVDRRVMPEFESRPMPSPADILAMTESSFVAAFKDTSIARIGLQRLQRNATATS